jgi:UDP-N-acetylmuramyl pentapeptide synthase
VLAAESPLAAYAQLKEHLVGDEAVLLKASRGVELESIMPKIREDFAGSDPAAGAEGAR